MTLSFIVAMDENKAIGINNDLPWQMPADLQHFKQKTLNKPIVMGRKTYESIGRALPKRRNIIITRDKSFTAQGCEVFHSTDDALTATKDSDEVMVIGGANIFAQMLTLANKLYLTIIHHQFQADTFLEAYQSEDWLLVDAEEHKADEENPYDYTFLTLTKR